ncbi:hypothetical protein C8J56DRAFT_881004 [Mycena floridula]|nr:hypothetical protein C8J56DRAFT_881004 [Mycena floridula]
MQPIVAEPDSVKDPDHYHGDGNCVILVNDTLFEAGLGAPVGTRCDALPGRRATFVTDPKFSHQSTGLFWNVGALMSLSVYGKSGNESLACPLETPVARGTPELASEGSGSE